MMALVERALAHFQSRTTDQAEAPHPIPIAAYVDAERYQQERQRIFKTLPLAVALSLELPDPGSYKALTVLETPLLLVRGDDGAVRVFLNVCRHRGARLCPDGRDKSRVFACPYHAWTYDRQGRLIGRYAADTFGAVDVDALGLVELPAAERCGLVWTILDSPARGGPVVPLDVDAWLGAFADELDTLRLEDWHLYEQREIAGPGWKVTMDGYLEVYHHNFLHGDTVGALTVGNLLVLDTFGPHQRLTFGRKSLESLADLPKQEWQPEKHVRLIHSCFPNLSISGILGDHCLVSQIFPGPSSDTTRTVQSVLAASKPDSQAAREAAENFSAMVLQAVRDEDYPVGFGIQAGLASGANSHFILGRNELAVQNYHWWVARFMDSEGVGWAV